MLRLRRFGSSWLALSIVTGCLLGSRASAAPTVMLRSPTVSAENIAFAYAQNIWVVPRAGGAARQVSTFQGRASDPHFSPDGR